MSKHDTIILYPSVCLDGAKQMAIDEMMLMRTTDDGKMRFRFYYWSAPTISLGYFQDYHHFLAAYPEFDNFDIVRRLTGGGAILHDREITYCLTVSSDSELYQAGPMNAYVLVHQAITDALKEFGIDLTLREKSANYKRIRKEPEFCFARGCPTDVISPMDRRKLAGSAQRRLPGAFMQHGSIIIESRFSQQPTLPLNELLSANNVKLTKQQIEDIILDKLSGVLHTKVSPADFGKDELALADEIADKYRSASWTIERKQ